MTAAATAIKTSCDLHRGNRTRGRSSAWRVQLAGSDTSPSAVRPLCAAAMRPVTATGSALSASGGCATHACLV